MAYINIETKEKVYAKVYKVFSGGVSGSFTRDIRTMYPDVDYTKLTNDDFICSYVSDSGFTADSYSTAGKIDTWTAQSNSFVLSPSYNPSTGVLTINPSTVYTYNYKQPGDVSSKRFQGLSCVVHMIVDGVREEYVK